MQPIEFIKHTHTHKYIYVCFCFSKRATRIRRTCETVSCINGALRTSNS